MTVPREVVERVFREENGRIVAGLIRVLRDFDLAEEAVQDALAIALEHWPAHGVPDNPGAWITTTARNKAIERLRRERARDAAEARRGQDTTLSEATIDELEERLESGIGDDRLRLIFTCCHPALDGQARVALTLRTLGGLTTAEIGRAFLVPTATLAQRLVRAKRKIAEARIPYRVPPGHLLPERLPGVLAVLYLVFNEGYSASSGDALIRRELCSEAIRLARVLVQLMPDEAEVIGLLALMLLHDSRRGARIDDHGDPVLLEDQDRSSWDAAQIEEGCALVERALRLAPPGPYALQAAIAALHAEAKSPGETDWQQIVLLYDALIRAQPTPVVALNRAVAVSMVEGPERGLELLAELRDGGELEDYQWFHAARAELLRRCGRSGEAAAAYRRAIELAGNAADRRHLERRSGPLSQ